MNFKKIGTSALATFIAMGANASTEPMEKFFVDYANYEEYIYSDSKKTEVGDQVELEIALKYNFSKDTFAKFRFETSPEDNRFDNKTSKFETRIGHTYKAFTFQVDGELQTDESDNGGTSMGLDLDSESTFISYKINNNFNLTFYPFNFDGEVGEEFNTWDVTRIYFIDGQPSDFSSGTQPTDVKIAEKTIPGFVLTYSKDLFKAYAGIGKATYEHPVNSSYDVVNNAVATRWERREDTGYKFGLSYNNDESLRLSLDYVTHTEAKETGSLLETAASAQALVKLPKNILIEAEIAYSKAGEEAWNTSRSGNWFSTTTPFQPVYADNSSNIQDWVGKSDMAYALKVGMVLENQTPYFFVRHQGEHFIFIERESAHRLRTADDSLSHGGLLRYGIGSKIRAGNFSIQPEFEILKAKNPVFTSSSDLRADRINSSFVKNDYLLYLEVNYDFDGHELFSF
ncbi:hypothetical protein [Bacteriovorax sp. DB6_IX]|uniref:hypothetical protein n=1 Tax=Bacteriovorax sp. DB6_IX TaxID=1353530 RepID=UPI000389F00B|nr:hypothetical protein [Bacteriovorax sp. DB6_IX]EQC52637.1 hypothetical protein M901_0682 [Bacteriovorax sp. DB6_IX]